MGTLGMWSRGLQITVDEPCVLNPCRDHASGRYFAASSAPALSPNVTLNITPRWPGAFSNGHHPSSFCAHVRQYPDIVFWQWGRHNPGQTDTLSICLSICLSLCISVSLSICLSVSLSVSLSIWLSVYLSIYLSICLFVCLLIGLYPSPSHLSLSPSFSFSSLSRSMNPSINNLCTQHLHQPTSPAGHKCNNARSSYCSCSCCQNSGNHMCIHNLSTHRNSYLATAMRTSFPYFNYFHSISFPLYLSLPALWIFLPSRQL